MGHRYLISYDLRGQNKNYDRVHSALRAISATPVLESLWTVERAGESAKLVAGHILPFIDLDDGLLVIEIESGRWDKRELLNPLNRREEL